MYQVSEAIWERGEVSVTSPIRRGDVAKAVRGADHGRYSKYGVGLSVVALPFYGASHRILDRLNLAATEDEFGNLRTGPTIFGTGLTNALLGGAAVAVTFLVAVELGYSLLAALATAFALGAATLLAHYASTFLSEPLSALCLSAALLAMLRARRSAEEGATAPAHGALALAGFSAGLVVATKVAHLVMLVPLFAWAALLGWRRARWRGLAFSLLAWGVGCVGWLAAIGLYNRSRFGSLFETGYGREAGMFTTPLWEGLMGLLVSPAKGIVWFSPILLLSLLGACALWRRDREAALAIVAASLAWLGLISRYYQWYGGGCWGPRFLVPLLPLWILPAAEVAEWARRSAAWRWGGAVVLAASVAVAVTPLVVPFDQAGGLLLDEAGVESALWKVEGSHALEGLAQLPRGLVVTARKLAGGEPLGEAGRPASGPRSPDFAFEQYGSHALLEWSRAAFAIAALALSAAIAGAVAAGRRAQKALLSKPPQ